MGLAEAESGQLWLRFWGVRGSYPTPGRTTVRTGGNSVCMEVRAGNLRLAFDAGTGLIAMGSDLFQQGVARKSVHIFLSHYHHDHIEGLRFFRPVYERGWRTTVYGPALPAVTLPRVLAQSMARPFFPVGLDELPGRVQLRTLASDTIVRLGDRTSPLRVRVRISHAHPKIGVALYRLEFRGHAIVYATDIEAARGGFDDVVALAQGADVLVHDAQYTDEEYRDARRSRIGWGHSTIGMACEAARAASVRHLFLYHHDPSHDDAEMHALERQARRLFPHTQVAREGLEFRIL